MDLQLRSELDAATVGLDRELGLSLRAEARAKAFPVGRSSSGRARN